MILKSRCLDQGILALKVFLASDLASLRFHANVTSKQVSPLVLQAEQPSLLAFKPHHLLSSVTCTAIRYYSQRPA